LPTIAPRPPLQDLIEAAKTADSNWQVNGGWGGEAERGAKRRADNTIASGENQT